MFFEDFKQSFRGLKSYIDFANPGTGVEINMQRLKNYPGFELIELSSIAFEDFSFAGSAQV